MTVGCLTPGKERGITLPFLCVPEPLGQIPIHCRLTRSLWSEGRAQPRVYGWSTQKVYTSIPCLIALSIIVLHRCFMFCKLEICGNSVLSKSISTIFSNSICSLHVSMSHLVILEVFHIFFIVTIFVMMICDQ